jgi:hypothetical protein
MATVHVTNPGVVTIGSNPIPISLRLGETFDSDDEVVRLFPHMFERASRSSVEQATAAPGEQRNVRRP